MKCVLSLHDSLLKTLRMITKFKIWGKKMYIFVSIHIVNISQSFVFWINKKLILKY